MSATLSNSVAASAPPKFARITSVDALRGLVMILMAIDHVRDFFHADALLFAPNDMTKTNAALFITRWITHICAPVFAFTAGIGAYYWSRRHGRSPSGMLVKRGLLLVVLEFTALRFAFFFNHFFDGPVFATVLWSLGWSMVALAGLVYLPLRALAVVSIAGIALHNLLDGMQGGLLWKILHQQGAEVLPGIGVFIIAYPLVPWIFIMSAGYCFGRLLEREDRRDWMIRIGAAMTIGFVILRAINLYGDPAPWAVQPNGLTWASFLNATKYPPSLSFVLMTIGPALLILAVLDRMKFGRDNPLLVFGNTPLFFFVGHFLLAHLLAFPLAFIRYGTIDFLWTIQPNMGGDIKLYPPGYGYTLGGMYAIWLLVLVIMYFLCRWYRDRSVCNK